MKSFNLQKTLNRRTYDTGLTGLVPFILMIELVKISLSITWEILVLLIIQPSFSHQVLCAYQPISYNTELKCVFTLTKCVHTIT